jgi:hypothetical protein
MCTHTQQKTEMNAKCTDIGTSFAADVESGKMTFVVELKELLAVDGSDTKLTFDGGDQGGALEECTSQCLQGTMELCLSTGERVMEADHADILLSGTLLRLDESGRAINADDEASSDLWIECAAVSRLLTSEYALDPCNDLVTGRVGRLVEVDHTGADIGLQVTLKGSASCRDRCEVAGTNDHLETLLAHDTFLHQIDLQLTCRIGGDIQLL